jgi:hypothetical protein
VRPAGDPARHALEDLPPGLIYACALPQGDRCAIRPAALGRRFSAAEDSPFDGQMGLLEMGLLKEACRAEMAGTVGVETDALSATLTRAVP